MTRHYLFADESGNFDFSRNRGATTYFAVGTVRLTGDGAVDRLRRDLLRTGTELTWLGGFGAGGFHASEDAQVVRDVVFGVLRRHALLVDVTVFEKPKVPPEARRDPAAFFVHAWREHFGRVVPALCAPDDELMVSVAAMGTRRMRAAFRTMLEQAVRETTRAATLRVVFAPADSDPALQAADYAVWAVARARERGDRRALDCLGPVVRSQHLATAEGAADVY